MTIKQAGKEKDFVWFFAKVEDRDDPLKLGRVRIRCFNLHTEDPAKLSKEYLPWATPIQPVTSAASAEIGISPTGMAVGSIVWGFFADGDESQIPLIVGTLAGIPKIGDNDAHDVSQRARGIDNLKNEYVEDVEPKMAFKAKYPYNKAITTESEGGKGHLLEIDDSPGAERLLAWHKKGTYAEIDKDGRLVIKSVDDSYFITVGDGIIHCGGNLTIVVVGSAGIAVGNDATIEVAGNLTANIGGDLTVNSVAGNTSVVTMGSTSVESDGNILIKSESSINIEASDKIQLKATRIDLN
jgi:hypothetical protein